MKLYKISSLIPLALGSLLPISANEYKFENIKFEQLANQQLHISQKIYTSQKVNWMNLLLMHQFTLVNSSR